MASSEADPPVTNLATLLLIKRKMVAKENDDVNAKKILLKSPNNLAGAHSTEGLSYHQNFSVVNPVADTTSKDQVEPPKVNRQNKQIVVELLDKKMEEINRKQTRNTNQALDAWKGFDSFNYGFIPDSHAQQSIRTPDQTIQSNPFVNQSSVEKQPSAKSIKINSASSNQPNSQTLPKLEEVQKHGPDKSSSAKFLTQPTIEENQTSVLPYTQTHSAPTADAVKPYESSQTKSAQSKSPVSIIEQVIPIASITSNPEALQKKLQTVSKIHTLNLFIMICLSPVIYVFTFV